jgi:hypothetical protein
MYEIFANVIYVNRPLVYFGLGLGWVMLLSTIFQAVSYTGEGNQSTWRKPPTTYIGTF